MNRSGHRPVRLQSPQRGGTLIEILVSVLVLSFGMLAIGNIMAQAVMLPKLSGNRAAASSLAIDLVERMRANVGAYTSNQYKQALTYDGSATLHEALTSQCAYPNCTPDTLAAQDLQDIRQEARKRLPAGGIFIPDPDASGEGRVYVLWREASLAGRLGSGNDTCPTLAANVPEPRCIMVKFQP